MALQKNIATSYGVDATHWIITKVTIDRLNLLAELQLAGYADKEAEKQKNTPLLYKVFNVNFSDNIPENTENISNIVGIPTQLITPEILEVFDKISKIGYKLVKKSEEFNDAEDDLIE